MPHTRSSKPTADSPLQSARVLPESEVAASRGLESLAPVEEDVFVEESKPTTEGQVLSIASPPILYSEDQQLRSLVGLESPSMSILEPYWKDDVVFQTSSPMTDDPSRFLQSGTSDELGKLKSPPRLHQKLAPVAESIDVVALGLERPFSDVRVNISSSSSKDEGHLNLPAIESAVGTRSSEVKDSQVDHAVSSGTVMGVGIPQSSPPVDTAVSASESVSDVEVTFKPRTTGRLVSASFACPDPPPDAAPGSVDVSARPKEASEGRHKLYLALFLRSLR